MFLKFPSTLGYRRSFFYSQLHLNLKPDCTISDQCCLHRSCLLYHNPLSYNIDISSEKGLLLIRTILYKCRALSFRLSALSRPFSCNAYQVTYARLSHLYHAIAAFVTTFPLACSLARRRPKLAVQKLL